jgi:hypothetical protein
MHIDIHVCMVFDIKRRLLPQARLAYGYIVVLRYEEIDYTSYSLSGKHKYRVTLFY